MKETILLILLLFLTSPLAADWQFTQWGMTQAELLDSGGIEIVGLDSQEVRTHQTPNGTPRFKMRYQAGEYTFDVYFLFGESAKDVAEGLTQIRMELRSDQSCEALYTELCRKYGEEVFIQKLPGQITTAEWKDHTGSNDVMLIYSLKWCTVVYTPLLDARDGL